MQQSPLLPLVTRHDSVNKRMRHCDTAIPLGRPQFTNSDSDNFQKLFLKRGKTFPTATPTTKISDSDGVYLFTGTFSDSINESEKGAVNTKVIFSTSVL